jgi:hypothetical protein
MRRILQHVGDAPFLIFGSRRIGKTSLLRQIQGKLDSDPHFLPLWVSGTGQKAVEDFFLRVRIALESTPHATIAQRIDAGLAGYHGLRTAFAQLRDSGGPLPVLLLDEVDELYKQDQAQDELLFKLLRDLSQSTPRLCSLVITGYRRIFLSQSDENSVFYNFAQPVHLREVPDDDLAYLIRLLKAYEVDFYNDQDAVNTILQGTYRIPYLVQTACWQLLRRLDMPERPDANRIEIEDVEIVLTGQIDQELMDELIRKIPIEDSDGRQAEKRQVRLRILLYAITLGKYGHTIDVDYFRPLSKADRYFTAQVAASYLTTWVDRLRPVWLWSVQEVDEMLQELRLTLAIGMVESGEERRYYFPQEIVPRLLHKWYQKDGRGSLLEDLAMDMDLYEFLCAA